MPMSQKLRFFYSVPYLIRRWYHQLKFNNLFSIFVFWKLSRLWCDRNVYLFCHFVIQSVGLSVYLDCGLHIVFSSFKAGPINLSIKWIIFLPKKYTIYGHCWAQNYSRCCNMHPFLTTSLLTDIAMLLLILFSFYIPNQSSEIHVNCSVLMNQFPHFCSILGKTSDQPMLHMEISPWHRNLMVLQFGLHWLQSDPSRMRSCTWSALTAIGLPSRINTVKGIINVWKHFLLVGNTAEIVASFL